eukprot:COSAG04_NODE_19515_length_414_cov_0.987302_1_plen_20_part_01
MSHAQQLEAEGFCVFPSVCG